MLNNEWDGVLKEDFKAGYFKKIVESVDDDYEKHTVFPPKDKIFAAMQITNFSAVKVCILGQDPYHGYGQANGMAFAVGNGVKFPPSLGNIFAELKSDLGIKPPLNGSLIGWAKQGVLLLNTTLTVREGQPQSHEHIGWQSFTDSVIVHLSKRQEPLVFILWGSSAIAKTALIEKQHCIISSPHPSPLSAHRGFFGSKPFSKANSFLVSHGLSPIDWSDFEGNRASYYQGKGAITKI